MTNREWLFNKMQNMSDEELVNVYVGSHICEEIKRTDCGTTNCINCKLGWLKEEHEEKIELSEAERIILENGNKDFNWLARDKSGGLYVYTEKPCKNDTIWENTSRSLELTYFTHLFQFITWNDEQPYNIEELLKCGD